MDERPFVPSGIDADSWLGFEQRIQQRRFHSLLETAQHALASGEGHAAREALDEARALEPDAAELSTLYAQLTAHPLRQNDLHPIVAALAVGTALLLALYALRPPTEAPLGPTPPAAVRVEQPPAPPA